ncbi:MAG: flavodoxin family protein [Clostridia bacterium]|nr:flavodoxin family protein [Clostridia bacterium]
MSKKIIVLNGSPRPKGNTAAMISAFTEAAEANGHEVERFDAAFHEVGGCHACMRCYSEEGRACVFGEEFNRLAPRILEADVIVFATPVYWYTLPAQIKEVLDKCFAFMIGEKDIAGKGYATIICCEEDDMSVIDGARVPIERSAALMKWNPVGHVLIPGVFNEGDIEKTDGCAQAAALGASL